MTAPQTTAREATARRSVLADNQCPSGLVCRKLVDVIQQKYCLPKVEAKLVLPTSHRDVIGNLRPDPAKYTIGIDCMIGPQTTGVSGLIFVHDNKGEVNGAKGYLHLFKDGSTKLPAYLSRPFTYSTSGIPDWVGEGVCILSKIRDKAGIRCRNTILAPRGLPNALEFAGCRACENKEGANDCYKHLTK